MLNNEQRLRPTMFWLGRGWGRSFIFDSDGAGARGLSLCQ